MDHNSSNYFHNKNTTNNLNFCKWVTMYAINVCMQ